MGKYSSENDVRDELIKQFTKRADHIQAQEYVDKTLSKLGINSENAEPSPLLTAISVCYATYKRAFYESKTKDDIFYQKYKEYEKELRELTADLMRKSASEDDVKAGSNVSVESFRG